MRNQGNYRERQCRDGRRTGRPPWVALITPKKYRVPRSRIEDMLFTTGTVKDAADFLVAKITLSRNVGT